MFHGSSPTTIGRGFQFSGLIKWMVAEQIINQAADVIGWRGCVVIRSFAVCEGELRPIAEIAISR
jgi:hypothetical protein